MCKRCFDVGPQRFGTIRARMEEFRVWRELKKGDEPRSNHNNVPIQPLNNVEEELQRLVDGYKKHIGKSKIKSFMTEALSFVKIPDWQKSKYWMVRRDKELILNSSRDEFSLMIIIHYCWN